ncbi:MAG: PilZ domain-containing protein [Spirochaetaceae bacterium]|jgi:c-di-GMP-binding flagellar brake protein YcgR|nr:PilZ domain-containing protein [Spirochaetaceae bacterium]
MGFFKGYLLQTGVSYFKEDDPFGAMVLLIGIGSVILISIIVNIVKRSVGEAPVRGGKVGTGVSERRFSIFQIHKVAAAYGLDKDQSKLLEYVFKSNGVSNPESVMQNTNSLDRHFKRAYKNIEKRGENEQEVQEFLSTLFSIRNMVEAGQKNANPASASTKRLSENMTAVLSAGEGKTFSVRVRSVKGDALVVECPKNAVGTPVKFPAGTTVTLAFFTKSSKGFSFTTKVLGNASTPQGPALQLAHTGKSSAMAQRRFRRREVFISCDFSLIRIQEQRVGKKIEKKMVVEPRPYQGTILDLSAGGCALKTSSVIPVGSRLKLSFENSDGFLLAALGQVMRTNRGAGLGIIMHIKFLKITRKGLNAVNAMVFGYDKD